ncbi:hypothetical protein HJG60_006279 [Phyllostomus discolor]|uniref:MHC class I-like antigen recognition-like domain-containing protein n=1 Tax=Phyllostomus discolor TaxID=89673 RepID=A0A834DF36_9CHIR|nr:hypothetical protein HJG60_006279 [Phyllostomus discolor]
MAPQTLLLLLSGTLALTQTRPGHPSSPTPGPHTLKYLSTAMYEPGREKYRYTMGIYLNDTEILSYDSNTTNSTLQPRVQWMEQSWVEQEGAQFWEEQTRELKHNEQRSRANLNKLSAHYNQSEDDPPPQTSITIIIMGIAAALGFLGAVITAAVLWKRKCSV